MIIILYGVAVSCGVAFVFTCGQYYGYDKACRQREDLAKFLLGEKR